VEQYRTEEEQVEALRKWWEENGRSTIAAVVIALAAGFGWNYWQDRQEEMATVASDTYQAMLQELGAGAAGQAQALGQQLKNEFSGSTYAQFAALHLARLAVERDDLAGAEAELRWALGQAATGSDIAQVAQLRLARVLAAAGNGEQGLSILDQADAGAYQAAYAVARGDILMQLGREAEAGEAYTTARMLAAGGGAPVNLVTLDQKIQSLNPVPARELDSSATAAAAPAMEAVEAVTEQAAAPATAEE
jgi:predicted negative regulator of RcsB-dependent stress response